MHGEPASWQQQLPTLATSAHAVGPPPWQQPLVHLPGAALADFHALFVVDLAAGRGFLGADQGLGGVAPHPATAESNNRSAKHPWWVS